MKKLIFIGIDEWDRPVYKDEQNKLWKDINLGNGIPDLHSSSNNEFDGEPNMPIKGEYEITKIFKRNPNEHQYMMLDMLKSRCDYFLGCYGNRYAGHLSGNSVEEHIGAMKKIWNSFPEGEKPEWLTMERIEEYEKEMLRDIKQ